MSKANPPKPRARASQKLRTEIISLTEDNLSEYRSFCGLSPGYREAYERKTEWLKARLREGMQYKVLHVNGRKAGFIEYLPGEFAWRAVEAKGYLFIHCLWVLGSNRDHGYGTRLLKQCLRDARGYCGVAVLTTSSTWLPGKKLFLKHGFEKVDEAPPGLELLAKRLRRSAPLPRIRDNWKRSRRYKRGLTIIQSDQCPYVLSSTRAAEAVARGLGIPYKVVYLRDRREAQDSPCIYGVTGFFYNGQLLTYHPIGSQRLKELLIEKIGAG